MTSAINVPVGVSADGAVAAAIDAKPLIPIEQAVRELEQVILPTQSASTQQLMASAFIFLSLQVPSFRWAALGYPTKPALGYPPGHRVEINTRNWPMVKVRPCAARTNGPKTRTNSQAK